MIIEVKNLSKVYKLYNKPSERIGDALFGKRGKPFKALDDINFGVEKGEAVGIIGVNGSGKSTLLKILAGVSEQTSGEKSVDGKVSAILELGAGFNPEYTGVENIYLNGIIHGQKKSEIKQKIDGIAEFAEIGEFINQPVKKYSSGMFARLAFSVAISVNPDILIVDEVLAVGDYRFQAKCFKRFEEMKEAGKTIIFVSHDVDAVRRFCTRAIWLNEGKFVMDGDVNHVTAKYMEFAVNGGSESEAYENIRDAAEFNAINRFGSDVGCIKRVSVLKNQKETNIFRTGEEAEIEVTVDIPDTANLEDTGFALSLKDKSGLDLYVTALHDENMRFAKTGLNVIRFRFPLLLNNDEYILTAGLEKRNTEPISYYDYIEGAAYIKVICPKEYFGVLRLPSEIEIEE